MTTSAPLKKIALCIGTRPEIIKIAPVVHALRRQGLQALVIHSGQHDSMAWPLYRFFDIQPDVTIDLKRSSGTLAHLGARLLDTIGGVLEEHKPDAVLVHGDTSTALLSALAAFYQQLPIGHVEAGLRTHSMYDPFPEEKNRELIGRLAKWHFAPTDIAVGNLKAEGVTQHVYRTGNTAVDAALYAVDRLNTYWAEAPDAFPAALEPLRTHAQALAKGEKRMLLVTAHRRENWGEGIRQIAQSVLQWLLEHPEYVAVWPVHGNPAVADVVNETFAAHRATLGDRLLLTEPQDYAALIWIMRQAWLILTDSGGIQEEAAALDLPVLVLRETTERPELVSTGRGVLVGARTSNIALHLSKLHADPAAYQAMRNGPNPFGNGDTSDQIATLLAAQG
jgi:UDP-N-acetylglucosamine 2-epimerase (non-hydrolysing)